MKRTTTKLADGRELIYYDRDGSADRDTVDQRLLEPVDSRPELRLDLATGDWVTIASHRQGRVHHPPSDACPLCPSWDGHHSEIPAAEYDVAVFENRFPPWRDAWGAAKSSASRPSTGRASPI